MHISTNATVPDHCSAYALSDPKDELLRINCDHGHGDICPQCEPLKANVKELGDALAGAQLSEDERDYLVYTFNQAAQAIKSWKANQLRSLQQEKARTTPLESLDETSVLIT